MLILRAFPRARSAIAFLALAVVAVPLLANTPARAASILYVAPGGSNNNPGSFAQPLQTIAQGLKRLYPGDTLYVRGGVYRERIACATQWCDGKGWGYRPGSAAAPVKVLAYPGERPVIKGVLNVRRADYWTFDGINVTWDTERNSSGEPLVKIMDGVGWTFKNAEVWGARSYAGILIGSSQSTTPSNWRLAGNCVHDTYRAHTTGFLDHNIYVTASPGRGVIERNILFNAPSGEQIKIGAATRAGPHPGNIAVRHNTMYNGSTNVLLAYGAHDVRIERNIIGRATGKNWYPNVRGYFVSGRNNVATSNFAWAADRFIMNTDSSTGVRNGGGNRFPINPNLNSVSSCSGFHPKGLSAQSYGRYGGSPVAGKWAADADNAGPGWFSGGRWRLRSSSDGGPADKTFSFGRATDGVVAGDWDGDGIDTPGLFRNGTWYLRNSNATSSGYRTLTYGKSGDRPVVGDWDGNGTDTVAVVRGRTWLLRNSNTSGSANKLFTFGGSSDRAVAGDWDGDGTDTPGVFRPSTRTWYLRETNHASSAQSGFVFGASWDKAVVGDWDGDGTDTVAVVRGHRWFARGFNTTDSTQRSFVFDLF